jgi:hypothetical protein
MYVQREILGTLALAQRLPNMLGDTQLRRAYNLSHTVLIDRNRPDFKKFRSRIYYTNWRKRKYREIVTY